MTAAFVAMLMHAEIIYIAEERMTQRLRVRLDQTQLEPSSLTFCNRYIDCLLEALTETLRLFDV
jgi:acyl-CoA thioesterase FadM